MPMTPDAQQTAVRRSRWKGQHGQEIRMAETLPDDEDDEEDIDEEEDISDEEDIDEEDIDEEDDEEEEEES
jgi:hypothetical protein